jgi:hypothetical protein
MGAVQNFHSGFVGANSSTLYVTALGGWTALSCQAQIGEMRDKNCSYCNRHSEQDFCTFGTLKLKKLRYFFGTFIQEKLHYSFGTFAQKSELLLGTFTHRKLHMPLVPLNKRNCVIPLVPSRKINCTVSLVHLNKRNFTILKRRVNVHTNVPQYTVGRNKQMIFGIYMAKGQPNSFRPPQKVKTYKCSCMPCTTP